MFPVIFAAVSLDLNKFSAYVVVIWLLVDLVEMFEKQDKYSMTKTLMLIHDCLHRGLIICN